MGKKTWALLSLIVVFGLVVRIFKISSLPLYGDELTMVYDTYSILKTGMDSTGEKLPLTFKMGAGRPGGYIYFSLPFVYLFGPNIWGERSLSILSGAGIIILMYFLGKKLFDKNVGLLASFLTAISLWDIFLSRGGFEAHFALFLALFGITMFFYKKYIFWAISWGLAFFTYPTFKVTLPLLFILLTLIKGIAQSLKDKKYIAGFFILFVFGAIAATQTFTSGSEDRFFSQNILSDEKIKNNFIQIVSTERTTSTLPEFLKPIFINRKIEYGKILLDNYIANLSPSFLFLRGDGNPRHNPGEMGMLYLAELPILLASIFLLWKEDRKKFTVIFGWILITPLSTMLMGQTHALRNGLMLPALILLTSFVLVKIPKKFVKVFWILVLLQLTYILIRLYTVVPAKFANFWSAEAKEAAEDAIRLNSEGQSVTLYINKIDNIEYAYEVYAKVDPLEVISQYGKPIKIYDNVAISNEQIKKE